MWCVSYVQDDVKVSDYFRYHCNAITYMRYLRMVHGIIAEISYIKGE